MNYEYNYCVSGINTNIVVRNTHIIVSICLVKIPWSIIWMLLTVRRMILFDYFHFFNLKQILEITSFDSIIYQVIPPMKDSTNLYPGSTVLVQLWIIPDRRPLYVIPWAISHSRKMLSNKISTGLDDRLYSSYVILLNPSRSLLQSSGTNVITGPWVDISIIDPSVEKLGFIVNG